jgi:hypothetical protein
MYVDLNVHGYMCESSQYSSLKNEEPLKWKRLQNLEFIETALINILLNLSWKNFLYRSKRRVCIALKTPKTAKETQVDVHIQPVIH